MNAQEYALRLHIRDSIRDAKACLMAERLLDDLLRSLNQAQGGPMA